MIVRCASCCDVASLQFANIGQTAGAPGRRITAKPLDQEVRRERCVPSNSVRKRVDGDEAMMESDCYLIRREMNISCPRTSARSSAASS